MQYSAGIVIKDGDLLWILDDARDGACVGDVVLRPVLKAGYLEANGQEVSASKYPRLLRWAKNSDMLISEEKYKLNCAKYVYDKVRDKLKLPNVSNRFLQARGGGAIVSEEAGLPNIIGKFYAVPRYHSYEGAFVSESRYSAGFKGGDGDDWGACYAFDASKSNEIYGKSDTVQPASIKLIAGIKY